VLSIGCSIGMCEGI